MLAERLWEDYTEFPARDLSELDVAYLFVDGVAERLHPSQKREPTPTAWDFTSEGKKVLLGLMVGSKEDAEAVLASGKKCTTCNLLSPTLLEEESRP